MSRSNKNNNGRKKLFKSENDARCSSSSSSSNSEDGDVICRRTSATPDARSSPYPARVLGGGAGAAAALKGGSEAPTDLIYEYLTRDHRAATREPTAAADKIRTNLKIVRIRKFQSNKSKMLLIVDVPPAVRQQQLEQQQKQQQPPPHPQAGGAVDSASPSLPPLEMGSREIFELSDELAKKFDVDKETSESFEWRSFSRPDDVIKLLLNDGEGGKSAAAGGPDEQSVPSEPPKSTVAAAAEICSIAEDVAPGDDDGCGSLSKPATKRKRISANDREGATATGFELNDQQHCEDATDDAKMWQRARLTNDLLSRPFLNACPGPGHELPAPRPAASTETPRTASTETTTKKHRYARMNETLKIVRHYAAMRRQQGFFLNACPGPGHELPAAPRPASTETTTTTNHEHRDTMVDETWKVLKNCATMRRENVDTLHVLLGEDNAKGVSNCGADTSTSDANDDALNSSNSDDNDAKAKKKNRCALCRKKVGLTGFECRCGGLYCGMHRYSDKHNCTFDYRQLGAQEIRRNNPVVIGEKIQKI